MPPSELIEALRLHAEQAGLWRPVTYEKSASIDWRENGDAVIILQSGMLKLTYLTASGDEWIKSFIVDQGLCGSIGEGDADVSYRIVCLEPSIVVRLSRDWVRARAASDPRLQAVAAGFWSWLSARKRDRESALLCLNATDRYLEMKAAEPPLVERLPQGDIARYLGITPIAFSRLKRRLRGN